MREARQRQRLMLVTTNDSSTELASGTEVIGHATVSGEERGRNGSATSQRHWPVRIQASMTARRRVRCVAMRDYGLRLKALKWFCAARVKIHSRDLELRAETGAVVQSRARSCGTRAGNWMCEQLKKGRKASVRRNGGPPQNMKVVNARNRTGGHGSATEGAALEQTGGARSEESGKRPPQLGAGEPELRNTEGTAMRSDGRKRTKIVSEERKRERLHIESVNVHTLALTQRKEGAGASRAGPEAMRRGPNEYLGRLLERMQLSNGDGSRVTSLFILASTQLPARDIGTVTAMFEALGYACDETHGVKGQVRREEIAGVMLCWDLTRLHRRPVAKRKQADGSTKEVYKQVVAQGRAVTMRFGLVQGDANKRAYDFDCIGVYPPPRGSGRRGHETTSANDDVQRVRARIHKAVVQLSVGGNLLAAGDWNSEPGEALKLRRDGEGSVATPSDAAHAHMIEAAPVTRLHPLKEWDWTYTNQRNGKQYKTYIDHMYGNAGFASRVAEASVVEGIETGVQRHRALRIVYETEAGERVGWGENKREAVRLCRGNARVDSEIHWKCRRIYLARSAAAIRGRAEELRGMRPWERLVAIQETMAEAMELARYGVAVGDSEGERRVAAKRREGRRQAERGGEEQVNTWETANFDGKGGRWQVERMRARLESIRATPVTQGEWLRFVPEGVGLSKGRIPTYYKSFGLRTEVARRVANIYSRWLETQILRGNRGGLAEDWQIREIGVEETPRGSLEGGLGSGEMMSEDRETVSAFVRGQRGRAVPRKE